jgi:hypothetical protein
MEDRFSRVKEAYITSRAPRSIWPSDGLLHLIFEGERRPVSCPLAARIRLPFKEFFISDSLDQDASKVTAGVIRRQARPPGLAPADGR